MDIRLDNFMAFKNFHMNMSYPKKIVNSYIEEEFLKDHPNFRYKKVNIIMGANASGKTSLGRMLMNIFNFMDKKEMEKITGVICDTHKKATFSMDFVTYDGDFLYRIITQIAPKTKEFFTSRSFSTLIIDVSNAFRVFSKTVIIQDGELTKADTLSSGTKAGIAVAGMLTAIINGENGFYYCDEKFSYIHTDIEKAFLTLMIQCLKGNDQLFFTTHNTDILDLPLPKHTFTFFKKDTNDDMETIKCINVSDFLKRSTDSVKNAAENDLFSVAPSMELIYELEKLK